MKITFPHMGDTYIPVKVLLETAGIDYVMPPVSDRSLLDRGYCTRLNLPVFLSKQ